MQFNAIGVIGAGQMGAGIAQVCAQSGYRVLLNDKDPSTVDRSMATIERNLRRLVSKGRIAEDVCQSAIARIIRSRSVQDLSDVDFVIEAATESLTVKERIFQSVCEVLPEHAILATNTSSISITKLASATDRPDRFIGVHFMNPVPVMNLVELIRGLATTDGTYEASIAFARSLNKTVTNAEDYPAFIVNRVLIPMINEAVYVLYEGVGSVESIDTAMKLGANHPMGPLQLADFIGLDTCLFIMQVLHDGLADTKYRPCPLLVKYVEAGWVGRKSGRGFYDYGEDMPRPTR